MLKTSEGYKLPSAPVEGLNIQAASLGGGFILTVHAGGRNETVVFNDKTVLTSYIVALFNPPALAQAAAPEAAPATVSALPKRKSKGGRPKGAKNKPKANGVDHAPVEAKPDAPAEALAEAA